MSLESELRRQISSVETTIAEYRSALKKAERDLEVWKKALELATLQPAVESAESNIVTWDQELAEGIAKGVTGSGMGFSFEEAKNKTALVLAAIRRANGPIRSAELISILHPIVSRSMIFKAIADLKGEGIIRSQKDGRLVLNEERKQVNLLEMANEKEATEAAS